MRPTRTAQRIVIPLKEPAWRRMLWPLLASGAVLALMAGSAALDQYDEAVAERRVQQLRDAHEQGRQQGIREAAQGLDVPSRQAFNNGFLEGLRVCTGGQL